MNISTGKKGKKPRRPNLSPKKRTGKWSKPPTIAVKAKKGLRSQRKRKPLGGSLQSQSKGTYKKFD